MTKPRIIIINKEIQNLETKESEDIVMIGDTLHDCEIGNQFGIDVFLVANGHQDYKRLQHCKAKVFQDLREAVDVILD